MIYALVVLALAALDQLSKVLVLSKLKPIGSYPIIQDVFHFTYAENTGAAFSIFQDRKHFVMVITTIALAAIFFHLVQMVRESSKLSLYISSLTLILAGGIGNLIDRFRLGYVVDFIDFRILKFAIFNVADIFIVVGVFLIFVDLMLSGKRVFKK